MNELNRTTPQCKKLCSYSCKDGEEMQCSFMCDRMQLLPYIQSGIPSRICHSLAQLLCNCELFDKIK